ncbi:MAG TPA: SDR family NAD(P)-dependent oxidoreductase [Microbacterium sp.]|nr:SDR family NAD(P)-dependent oxidoreductase [Microbacterium sp.]
MHSRAGGIGLFVVGEQDDEEDTAVLLRFTAETAGLEGEMDLQLHGRTALITGAASGIGRAVAMALAGEGMRLALLDREAAGLRETAGACADAVLLVADVTDEDQVSDAVKSAVGALGGLDAVVCCAGISGPVGTAIDETSREQWDVVFAVNVTGTFLVVKHSLPALRASDSASVVLLASDSALVASPGMAPYCASKAALVQLGRALSVDEAAAGVRVNAVAPSVVDTPMSRGDLGTPSGFAGAEFPVQSPAEVAAHVTYLVSPRSRAINGTTVLSDFGYTARSGFPA